MHGSVLVPSPCMGYHACCTRVRDITAQCTHPCTQERALHERMEAVLDFISACDVREFVLKVACSAELLDPSDTAAIKWLLGAMASALTLYPAPVCTTPAGL